MSNNDKKAEPAGAGLEASEIAKLEKDLAKAYARNKALAKVILELTAAIEGTLSSIVGRSDLSDATRGGIREVIGRFAEEFTRITTPPDKPLGK